MFMDCVCVCVRARVRVVYCNVKSCRVCMCVCARGGVRVCMCVCVLDFLRFLFGRVLGLCLCMFVLD